MLSTGVPLRNRNSKQIGNLQALKPARQVAEEPGHQLGAFAAGLGLGVTRSRQ